MTPSGDPEPNDGPEARAALARAADLQAAYAASRRDWAERVGRPYRDDPDRRPPPGALDAEADE